MRFGYLIATLLLIASPAMAWEYRNPEFGFNVTIPEAFPRCDVGERHAFYHEDGFVAFIDGKPGDCIEQQTRRVLGHFGHYNAPLYASLDAMRKEACPEPYRPADQWHIGGLPAQACRVEAPDGWIALLVYAVSAEMETGPDNDFIPRMIYSAYLHTRMDTLADDLRLFRAQLGRVKFFPPE